MRNVKARPRSRLRRAHASRNILGYLLRTVSCGHACAISMRVIVFSKAGFGIDIEWRRGDGQLCPTLKASSLMRTNVSVLDCFWVRLLCDGDWWRSLGRYAALRYEALRNMAL